MEYLRIGQAYISICGASAPSEKVCRNTLALLLGNAADTLHTINQYLLSLKAKSEGTKEIAADFDDSVITVFGSQERPDIRYNPKYHGRPSFKE